MIGSGRALQASELRALKRDIGYARHAIDPTLDTPRMEAFRASAARQARVHADRWLEELEALAAEALAITEHDHFAGNTQASAPEKIDRLAADAAVLLAGLPALVGDDLAAGAAGRSASVTDRVWSAAIDALKRMAKRDVFIEHHFEDPDVTVLDFDEDLVWQLAEFLGHEPEDRPERIRQRMRQDGVVPLDVEAEPGRVCAEAQHRPTVLEICAGAGGQALGLAAAGFEHVGLVEINADAVKTMRHNRPHWPVIHADLRSLDVSRFKGIDLLAGGVPCQPFSAGGDRKGARDERDLFPEALRLVKELAPRAIMLENVTGALHVGNAVNRLTILSKLARLGYDAEWRILEGVQFGLPQKRRRAILVGFRRGVMHRFRWPIPDGSRAPTVGEALYDLMAANGWAHAGAWKERAHGYASTLIGGSQSKTGIDLAQEKSRDAWTDLGINPHGYAASAPPAHAPADHLPKLTLAMMARLQDFPPVWEMRGTNLQAFHQIANAFPPRMALAVGSSILRALTGSELDLPEALARPIRRTRALNLRGLRSGLARQSEDRRESDAVLA